MTIGHSRKLTVEVWDKPHEIYVTRRSKTVWLATGKYMDEPISAKGRSETQAVNAWREAARYKGNL